MLKYMLTSKCNRKCEYCITRNIDVEEEQSLFAVFNTLLEKQKEGHTEIMLTGGEPTLSKQFLLKLKMAHKIFNGNVHITTQNADFLSQVFVTRFFKTITFSLHDITMIPILKSMKPKVYGSIVSFQYHDKLAKEVKEKGFNGLTVNEEQREGETFDENILPELEDFSYKINRKGHCMDETIILPNLEVITDYTKYL